MYVGLPVRWTLALGLVGIALLVATPGHADGSTFRLSGLRLDLGQSRPQHASPGVYLGGSMGLGTLGHRRLDASVNVGRWSSEIDREELGADVEGTVSDLTVGGDLRWSRRTSGRVTPYIVSGLALHVVGADIPDDRSLEDALGGVKLGADLGLGLTLGGPGMGWALEARRRFVDDVGSWSLTAGVRLWRGEAPPRPASSRTANPGAATAMSELTITTTEFTRLVEAVTIIAEQNRALRSDVDALRASATRVPVSAPASVSAAVAAAPASAGPPSATPIVVRTAPTVAPAALARELDRELARVGMGEVELQDGAVVVRLGGEVVFPVGSSQLTLEAREALRACALALFRHPGVSVTVEGHADATGDRARNLVLSDERARAVRDELLRLRLDPDRILAVGIGPDRPIATNDTSDGRARNRRVEIWLTPESDAGHTEGNPVR